MEVLAARAAHYLQAVSSECLLCKAGKETVERGWSRRATVWMARAKRQTLTDWLDANMYKDRVGVQQLRDAVYDSTAMVL